MSSPIQLERCEICRGAGKINGIWEWMECAGCNGGGLVRPGGQALEYPDLVAELRMRLQGATRLVEVLRSSAPVGGPAADYVGMKNDHRPGGGNWTGD